MASLNKVILIGHLTADPELKQTPSGVSVTSFSIGVTRRFQRQGEQPQSDFINIVLFRREHGRQMTVPSVMPQRS